MHNKNTEDFLKMNGLDFFNHIKNLAYLYKWYLHYLNFAKYRRKKIVIYIHELIQYTIFSGPYKF